MQHFSTTKVNIDDTLIITSEDVLIEGTVTGDLIATASENRETPRRGYLQWANSVSNTKEARLMFENWARRLRERLDEARSTQQGELQ